MEEQKQLFDGRYVTVFTSNSGEQANILESEFLSPGTKLLINELNNHDKKEIDLFQFFKDEIARLVGKELRARVKKEKDKDGDLQLISKFNVRPDLLDIAEQKYNQMNEHKNQEFTNEDKDDFIPNKSTWAPAYF